MGEPAILRWTVEEFLDWEATQEERHELIGGEVRLMVDHYRREASGWHMEALTAAEDVIELTGLDISLRLADLYRGADMLQEG